MYVEGVDKYRGPPPGPSSSTLEFKSLQRRRSHNWCRIWKVKVKTEQDEGGLEIYKCLNSVLSKGSEVKHKI